MNGAPPTKRQHYWWVSCPRCIAARPECDICLGTDRDPIPWAELFPWGRPSWHDHKGAP